MRETTRKGTRCGIRVSVFQRRATKRASFFPYSDQPSMDEPPSRLLKSRIPRKTILYPFDLGDWESLIRDAHCPLRKGIICYHRHGTIFEHNIHSSGKHEPRIIVPNHPSRRLENFSFVPIRGNRILLFARYSRGGLVIERYLHLSIHEIRSDHRIGPALWSFNGSVDGRFDIGHLELIKSTKNELGITFWARFDDHWKLLDISTAETDTSDKFPLIESGRIDFDLKFKLTSRLDKSPVILSPDMHILLNVDLEDGRHNETIDIHYLDSGGTSFSFITRLSIPVAETDSSPGFAFSADGSKFTVAMQHGGMFVWDIRSKVPLRTFTGISSKRLHYPQFSSRNLGKEILVFAEHASYSENIHVIDATSFETDERLILKKEHYGWCSLFFDPYEGTLHAEVNGTIYEWDLRKKEPGPEWWIGEE